jgi:hypothetical protein
VSTFVDRGCHMASVTDLYSCFEKTLATLICRNVLVFNIQTGHYLIKKSVRKANVDINKVSKKQRNVKVLDLSNVSRAYHARQGGN